MILRAKTLAWRWHGAALVAYALLAVCFIDHGESLTRGLAGQGSDPFAFIWFLAWWPWAIGHHIDPLFTNLVWQPAGVYLDWVTSVPLLAVAGWPLTLVSPVLTFNFFILTGPVFAAFSAYLLCLRVTRDPLAAVIGGFLFGYSSYEMAQGNGTLNLSFTALVPLLLLAVLQRLDGRLSRIGFIAAAGLILVCQFLLCIEVFALVFVFGGIFWALALLYLPEQRAALRRLAADGLYTAPPVLAVLSPVLVSMARHAGTIQLPAFWPYYYTTDLLNFFVPTRANLFGGGLSRLVAGRFNGGIQEQDGYLGLPLLVIVFLFAREQAGHPARRLLLVMFLLLAILTLGPQLWIGGHPTGIMLPWRLFLGLPLLKSALPARFCLFVSLCAAVIAAIWVAAPGQRKTRLALAGLACIALLPGFHPWMSVPASKFFQPGRVQAALGANARLLVLPFAINGASSFWQAENRFGFSQTGGYLGIPPKPMQGYRAAIELFEDKNGGSRNGRFLQDFVKFCAATGTQFVVIGPGTAATLQANIAALRWPARQIDDVTVYTVPGQGNPRSG